MNDDHLMLEHSVIRIIGKDGKTTCGTGFLVADNIAVTCAHVIGIAGTKPGTPVQIKFDGSDDVQWATVDEAHFSPGSVDDIAFIILNDIPDHVKPLPLASARKSDGHSYKSYGYPNEAEPVKARKPTASINGVVPASEPGVQPLLEVKGEEWGHGLSGAPIFDLSYQAVVGMVTQGKKLEKTLLGYATTADTICLHHLGIRLEVNPVPGLIPFPPQGTLPDPAPLPSGSRMTHPRNQLFTGREEDLLALAAELLYSTNGRTVALTQPVAAAGMGGIGKTQLATEFCYRYGQFCEGVHWINAANPDGIGAEIAACGLAMGIQPWSDKQPEQVEATLREWSKSKRRIVVLDNLEEPSALGEWIPRLQKVHILATTRRVDWPPELGLRVQRLERFPRAVSLHLIRKLCPRLKQMQSEALGELADLLCDLPLAVDLAGRYLHERKKLSLHQYIEDLEVSGVLGDYAMSDEGANDATRHLKSLEATFEMSWKELNAPEGTRKAKEMQFARLLFHCAGYCAPAVPITGELLRLALRENVDPNRADKDFDAAYYLGLARLSAIGLLEQGEEGYTIHPLLAEFAQNKADERAERLLFSLASVLASGSYIALDTEIPDIFLSIRPHLESVAFYVQARAPQFAVPLWNNLGAHLKMTADFSGARRLFELALVVDEKVYGGDHPNTAIHANNLGGVLRALGDLQGAKANLERALRIDEKVYGKENSRVSSDLNNLALVLQDLGDLQGAKTLLEEALKIDEKVYSQDHSKVALGANNLGSVLQQVGDLLGAHACFERALAIDKKVYGKEHPSVARDENNLGILLRDLGDLQGAKEHFEHALSIVEKVYSNFHPYIAFCVNNLGAVLQDLGDLAGAKTFFERALTIDEMVYGNEHPDVARDANNLGALLSMSGDFEGAKKYYQRSLAIIVKFLPDNHPKINLVRKNIITVESKLRAKGMTTDIGNGLR